MQNIYFYIDDSGVFNDPQNEYFVFAGFCLISANEKEIFLRSYSNIENKVKNKLNVIGELKGFNTPPEYKDTILRRLNRFRKMGTTIHLPSVNADIKSNKYSSQRYKDYALKLAIKHKLGKLIGEGVVNPDLPVTLWIKIDRHNIATDGIYGLKESIFQELKVGITNFRWNTVHPPIFKSDLTVYLDFCDSANTRGIRAADFIANKLLYESNMGVYNFKKKVHIKRLP